MEVYIKILSGELFFNGLFYRRPNQQLVKEKNLKTAADVQERA